VIVLDASVLIAYLDGEDDHHAAAEKLLADTIDDDLGANSLTLAEVLVVPVRTGSLEVARTALRDLEVHEVPLPADTAVRLAQLRVSTRLRMPDCCALLAAEDAGASIASFDERLAQAAESREVPVVRR
jgi:predicted nucleic acid-binding protein